jgi:xanthine dehydrogenase YagS FAD-binding subunit
MTVHRPSDLASAAAIDATPRAGNTDLGERRRRGRHTGDVVDLGAISRLAHLEVGDDGAHIGATVTVERIATDSAVRARYGVLAAAAADLGTPQIRRMATLGGNLLQSTRCWYARSGVSCYRTDGRSCPARTGDHRHHIIFDLGQCVSPHPSTLAVALLLYDTEVVVAGGYDRSLEELLGDGSDPTRSHTLGPSELIAGICLGPNESGDATAYVRATSRRLAEWPTVEAAVRLRIDHGTITEAVIAVGGVAPIPLRRSAAEEALVGRRSERSSLEDAAALVVDGADSLPGTGYKIDLTRRTVLAALLDACRIDPG